MNNKVLILSYFYPPSKFTASNRPLSWAMYLSHFGYFPVVITFDWASEENSGKYMKNSAENIPRVVTTTNYQIHYLPIKYISNGNSSLLFCNINLLRRVSTFLDLVINNYTLRFNGFRHLENYAYSYLMNNINISIVIATANPFSVFHVAARLKRKIPAIKWIADYRDDWSTQQLNRKSSLLFKLIYYLNAQSEKKWVYSAEAITSVSKELVNRISSYVEKPGFVISNGYFEEDFLDLESGVQSKKFIITYTGMLYHEQKIDLFITLLKAVIDVYNDRINIIMRFVGVGSYPQQMKRIINYFAGYESHLELIPNVSRLKCIDLENEADAFLMVAYGNEKGIPSSKLFQYIGHRKPIVLYPSDHDIVEDIIVNKTKLGIKMVNDIDVIDFLKGLIEEKLNNGPQFPLGDMNYIQNYTRRKQTEELSKVLDWVKKTRN